MNLKTFNSAEEAVVFAKSLHSKFESNYIFHGYWNGEVTEKHLISVRSCYLQNIKGSGNKIIFWHENSTRNVWLNQIERYAEIREFDLQREIKGTIFESLRKLPPISRHEWLKALIKRRPIDYMKLTYLSDQIRCILLSKYGGIWFDLDIFFLRNMDPVLVFVEGRPFAYEWPGEQHPNNAVFGHVPKSREFEDVIYKIHCRGRGWGFQQAMLTYDLPINLTVLPCAWFDPGWLDLEHSIGFNFFHSQNKAYSLESFHNGSFTYHWHNQWNAEIENSSVARMLDNEVKDRLSEN